MKHGGTDVEHSFRELDDLILHLKGLVLVRSLRERNGAEPSELNMYAEAIDDVRDRLAGIVTMTNELYEAAA
jgi:chemotaxis regulatin CheY-phosphate phosphatase CheZ